MIKSEGSVTIKSIAQALGVSFSTVSKALNGDPNISEKTRKLVEEKANEMHYTRNYFASSLRQKGSKTVAIIVNDIDVPAYAEMVAMISTELSAYGYTTLISDTRYSPETERVCVQNVLSRMPEAVIVSPMNPTEDNLSVLRGVFPHTLVLGEVPDDVEVSSLSVSHRHSGYLSAKHMLTCGVKKNLIFGGPEGYQSSELFLAGIQDAYAEAGEKFPEDDVFRFKPDSLTAKQIFTKNWEKTPGHWDGVICFCDSMAFGVYSAARALGLSVPEDVSVIGYDDCPTNEFVAPPLTSIHMPKDLVAKHCSQFVLDHLVGGDNQLHTYRLEPFLADRGSVRKKQ